MGGNLTLTDKCHINTDAPIIFKNDVKHSFYLFEVNNFFFQSWNILFKKYLTDELLKKYQLDLSMNQNENDTLDIKRIYFVNYNPEDYQFNQKLYLILPPLYIGIGNNYY